MLIIKAILVVIVIVVINKLYQNHKQLLLIKCFIFESYNTAKDKTLVINRSINFDIVFYYQLFFYMNNAYTVQHKKTVANYLN